MSIESSSSLPEDLLIDIFVCLPVKTLLRFKTVSKSWFVLIESSEFIHRHAITTLPPDNIINSSSSSKLGPFIFHSRHVERYIGISWNFLSISGDCEFQVYEDLGMPPCYRNPISLNSIKNLIMVGSCNGVICIYDDELRDVSLWNPAIHQFRILPKSSLTCAAGIGDVCRDGSDFVAFGFDPETKDYKVVLVLARRSTDHHRRMYHRVQVYDLSTDSWRTLVDVVMPTERWCGNNNNAGYLNGSYYSLGRKPMMINSGGNLLLPRTPVLEVVSFDFTKEIFKILQLPDGTNNNKRCIPFHYLGIIILGGKLVIISHHMPANTYEFWVLNEIGVEESWTKLYKIESRLFKFGSRGHLDERMIPMGISNNGEYIVIVTSNGEKLWLLNPSTQETKELQWDRGNRILRAFVYRRSLVPVCSSTRINGSIYI